MGNRDEEYYRYLLTSEVSKCTAERHREIAADHFWNIFLRHHCNDVLDVGCGLGSFIRNAPQGVRSRGIDPNPFVVKHCIDAGLSVIEGSVEKIPLATGNVDGIMCSHVLEHIEDPEQAFREFSRILRPGGILIGRVPPFDRSFYDDWTHVRPFTTKSLTRLAQASGFDVIKTGYYRYALPLPGWRNPCVRTLNAIRRLPLVAWIFDTAIRTSGFPPRELVLIARRLPA